MGDLKYIISSSSVLRKARLWPKEDLCPSSKDINRLKMMMMKIFLIDDTDRYYGERMAFVNS
jgi:hypothetical protein